MKVIHELQEEVCNILANNFLFNYFLNIILLYIILIS